MWLPSLKPETTLHVHRGRKHFLPPRALEMGFALLFKLDDSCLAAHAGERREKLTNAEEEEEEEKGEGVAGGTRTRGGGGGFSRQGDEGDGGGARGGVENGDRCRTWWLFAGVWRSGMGVDGCTGGLKDLVGC